MEYGQFSFRGDINFKCVSGNVLFTTKTRSVEETEHFTDSGKTDKLRVSCMHGNEMPALICCNFVANFILFFFFSGLFYGISCDLQASAGKRICSAGRNSVLSDEEHFTVNFPRIFS